jgi:hypothetical protein
MMSRVTRSAACLAVAASFGALTCAPAARADAGWFESGDAALRADLLLLNDAGVILYPVSQWPAPRAGVRHALANAKEHLAVNAAVSGALSRMRHRLDAGAGRTRRASIAMTATGGQAARLRDFDTLGREDAAVGVNLGYDSGRVAVSLNVSTVTDPADDQRLRADGSHATVRWGNWLISAQTLDRWWGPAHESSLILSNNARPMPTLAVERAEARAFESPLLSWLGPWRFSFAISQMENERQDIDRPLFMAWRVVVMPFDKVELGFSRTAQFCGEQLACTLETFGNMLAGNDNVGFDATPENEPGNQMAGFDIRWASPIGNWPYAIYSQFIGEDESSYLPAKYLGQFGLEVWKPLATGGIAQLYAEYANTTCSGLSSNGPYDNCAFAQGRFNVEGYRYRGRVIGHTTDGDSESYALGGQLTTAGGDLWSAKVLGAKLNRDAIPDPRNTLTSVPADYGAVEIGWRGKIGGDTISIDVGVEAFEQEGASRETQPYGFLSWHHEFTP